LKIKIILAALSDADGAENFQISKFSTAISKLENVGHWNDQIVVADETHNCSDADYRHSRSAAV
jgi:hypothetical protein